jgi:hypothetical protein
MALNLKQVRHPQITDLTIRDIPITPRVWGRNIINPHIISAKPTVFGGHNHTRGTAMVYFMQELCILSLLYNGYRVSFPGVKRPGRDVKHPPPSSAEVKERVELYL